MVGERGPELIVPQMAGTVLTADQTSGVLAGPLADGKQQSGSEFSEAMLGQLVAELRGLRRDMSSVGGTTVDVRAESGVKISATERARAARARR